MKELREHVHSLKREYESQRYPGDLASQVLHGARPARRGWIGAAVVAAAASIAVVIWINRPPSVQPPDDVVVNTIDEVDDAWPDDQPFAIADVPSAMWPEMPDELDLAPSVPEFTFTVPSVSLVDENPGDEESTNAQEPVL